MKTRVLPGNALLVVAACIGLSAVLCRAFDDMNSAVTPARMGDGSRVYEHLLDLAIRTGGDDIAERADGSIVDSSASVHLETGGSGVQVAALRFTGVPIARGARIGRAYLQLSAAQTASGAAEMRIRAGSAADASALSAEPFAVANTAVTTSEVVWRVPGWSAGEHGPAQRSPDLSGVVQEVVDHPQWAASGSIVLVLRGHGARAFVSFDGDPQAAPVLRLEWSSGDATEDNVAALVQAGYVATGFDDAGVPLPVPSIDSAGIGYHAPSGRLVLADSEINEVAAAFERVGANIFELPLGAERTLAQHDLTRANGAEQAANLEPTGIAYCESDDHFYVTNDDARRIDRYARVNGQLVATDWVSTKGVTSDPEGITCDPQTGDLYVIGGIDLNIPVYQYRNGFTLMRVIDIERTAGNREGVPDGDSEGIAFDPVSRHLFVMSDPDKAIFEYTVQGVFVRRYGIDDLEPAPIAPQGITFAPSSDDARETSVYLSDGRIDNDNDPSERDGAIYQLRVQRGR